jgi:NAD(P)-dependent dehydrogenase (short-subunit alcohol dehydrogenase family)
VRALGAEALVLPCDIADPVAVEQSAQLVERELGPIDVWVNSAMVSVFAPVIEITAEEYRRVTEVTHLGVVHGTPGGQCCLGRRRAGGRHTRHSRV